MKRKYLWITLGVVCAIASILVMVFYVYPRQKALSATEWYEEDIREVAGEYMSTIVTADQKVQSYKYQYFDYDKTIESENQNREDKQYPFSAVEVYIRVDGQKYQLHLVVDESGALRVQTHKVKD